MMTTNVLRSLTIVLIAVFVQVQATAREIAGRVVAIADGDTLTLGAFAEDGRQVVQADAAR